MTSILSEKEYQHFIMDRLSQDNGYIVRRQQAMTASLLWTESCCFSF